MSLPKMTAATVFLSTLWFAAALPAQTAETVKTSDNASKVRIVRLSEVKGDVQMDRSIGRGMESAVANLPVVEQTRVQTAMGAAEVEFEDNSSLRMGPNSIVEFPKLERLQNGTTVSWIRVVKGTAYVSLMKSSLANQFTLLFGAQTVMLPPNSHIRLDMGTADAKLAVYDGTLKLQGASGETEVTKKKTVTFNLATTGELNVDNHVESAALDEWDKNSVGYHQRQALVSSANSSPFQYGMNDLSYYGSFMDAGSCGMGGGAGAMMWRPYFASAAWDPYSNGSWAWYGNSGYSWVSPYPWGWTPYHYGSWNYCPGMGWGWMPGGSWMGLNNIAAAPVQSGPGGTGSRPLIPGHPPSQGGPSVIPVNMRPLVRSELKSPSSFEFRKDSAGLGIPRDTLGKLDKLSDHTMTHGTASTQVYVSAPNSGMNGRASSGAMLGATVHRGVAAPRMGGLGDESAASSGSGRMPGASSGATSTSMPVSSHGPSMPAGGGPAPSSGGGSRPPR
jgi:FecR protein